MKQNLNEQNKNKNWLWKIVVCVMALIIGLTSLGLQVFAEGENENGSTEITSTPEPTAMPAEEPTATDAPVPSEEVDADVPTPTDAPATDETPDVSPDATPDDVTGAGGEESSVSPEETEEESKISASFESGVEEKEDGSYVWNVDSEEKEHTFAYRLELKDVNSSTVKIMTPTTIFRDGEEGDFIASDLEAEDSKLHLKVYEVLTSEDGTETKFEIKNNPRKEEPVDGVSAIAEANKEVAQETASPDISDIGGGCSRSEIQ